MFCQWPQQSYWSPRPVLITWLAGRTTGTDPLGLYQVKNHQHSLVLYMQLCNNWKTYGGLGKCIHRRAEHQHTDSRRHASPYVRGTVYPSRSLAPDCQGELGKWRWRLVSGSDRCAADGADGRRGVSHAGFALRASQPPR